MPPISKSERKSIIRSISSVERENLIDIIKKYEKKLQEYESGNIYWVEDVDIISSSDEAVDEIIGNSYDTLEDIILHYDLVPGDTVHLFVSYDIGTKYMTVDSDGNPIIKNTEEELF